jgi:hypothetical protein
MKQLIQLLVLSIAIGSLQSCGSGGGGSSNITLTWNAATKNIDNSDLLPSELVRYRLYYGNAIDSLSNSVEFDCSVFDCLAKPISYTLAKSTIAFVAPNTYYLAMSVINDQGIESNLSEVVSYTSN